METDGYLTGEMDEQEQQQWFDRVIAESVTGPAPQIGNSFASPICCYPLVTNGIEPEFVESVGFCGLVPGFSPEYDEAFEKINNAIGPETLDEYLGIPSVQRQLGDPAYMEAYMQGYQDSLAHSQAAIESTLLPDDPAWHLLSDLAEQRSRVLITLLADGTLDAVKVQELIDALN